jgi:6-pyruvoyltetrahydropterin/6-carboxytetrahydropterin synthase
MVIGITRIFCAAHFLPNHGGKCKNLHGHTYKVIVEVEGEESLDNQSPGYGMVIDIKVFKRLVDEVIEELDHSHLNTQIENPTMENLTLFITKALESSLGIMLKSVTVFESEGCYAKITCG